MFLSAILCDEVAELLGVDTVRGLLTVHEFGLGDGELVDAGLLRLSDFQNDSHAV